METESSKNCLPSDECTKNLDLFFANGLHNSCKATDELIKTIEGAQDEALAKRALTLYQRHYSTLDRPWDHVTFMYGLGLIYMHFNAYNFAIKAFRGAIYVQPNFVRSRDVHTRLGLIFKATGRFKLSEKHFNLALNDTRPDSGTSTKLEVEFQLAHLYEIQGKLKQAKEAYERLLKENDLPHQLSANIHRQLGWMYFYSDLDAPSNKINNNSRKQNMFNHQNALSNNRIDAALNYLNTSYQTDNDPKTSYYLGRCFTNIGKFQDAFASFRSVIDREESTADTWCSIGVLYHRQNQPTDALQAYIRAVQFDKHHSIAWMNLGTLYESRNQFNDALKCYQHVLRSSLNGVDKSLQARIRYIQKQMAEFENSHSNNGKSKISSDKLLSLEDLWNLESKTSSESCSSSSSSSNANNNNDNNTNNNNINNNASKNIIINTCSTSQVNPTKTTITTTTTTSTTPASKTADQQQPLSNGLTNVNHNKVPTPESLLNNCANNSESNNSKPILLSDAKSTHPSSTPTGNHIGLLNVCKVEISSQGIQESKPQSGDTKDFCLNQVLTNGASKDSGISSNSSTYADCALVPSQYTNVNTASYISADQVIEACKNSPRPRRFDVNLRTDEDDGPPKTFPKCPPYPPLPPDQLFPSPPNIFLETKKDLASKRLQDCCQSSPISVVRNLAGVLKLDLGLFSTKTLVESNPDHHVDISSHLYYHANEALEESSTTTNQWACERKRSSSTIARYASYQVALFRESLQEETANKTSGSKTNLTKESETDSNESASTNAKRANSNSQSLSQNNNELQPSNSRGISMGGNNNKRLKLEQPSKVRYVKSASKIDLSDEKKWRPQLSELNKLPNFIKCISASNILTHMGALIPGINTIVMSMHVPGCRILGNRTPNNFSSVSINVGPGDYEWYAISAEYSSILTRLCNRHGYELDGRNWWPKIEDLHKFNIPIYRFAQRPGDLVWVNSGTIYWIQATGWCNKIHWNVGPLSAKQYKSASESFELNKLLFRKSDVPMIQLTWNIVINIKIIFDEELYQAMTEILRRSLRYCALVKDFVDESKQKIYLPNEEPGPRKAKFCSLCECEVFNIHFNTAKTNDDGGEDGDDVDDNNDNNNNKHHHCFECARRLNPTFGDYEIRQEYDLNNLMKLYDNFIETRKKFLARHHHHHHQHQPGGRNNQA